MVTGQRKAATHVVSWSNDLAVATTINRRI